MTCQYPQIPTKGLLCSGLLSGIYWPVQEEYDLITELRNRVRDQFVDDRHLDPVRNREWLASRIGHYPREAVLSIRWLHNEQFIGTVGWTHWDPIAKSARVGRLALDTRALRYAVAWLPRDYVGPIVDALIALRTFLFEDMELNVIYTEHLADNFLSAKLQERIGLRTIDRKRTQKRSGTIADLVTRQLTRAEWLVQACIPSTRNLSITREAGDSHNSLRNSGTKFGDG